MHSSEYRNVHNLEWRGTHNDIYTETKLKLNTPPGSSVGPETYDSNQLSMIRCECIVLN